MLVTQKQFDDGFGKFTNMLLKLNECSREQKWVIVRYGQRLIKNCKNKGVLPFIKYHVGELQKELLGM